MTTAPKNDLKRVDNLLAEIVAKLESLPGVDGEVCRVLKENFLKSPLDKNVVEKSVQALMNLAKARSAEVGNGKIIHNKES